MLAAPRHVDLQRFRGVVRLPQKTPRHGLGVSSQECREATSNRPGLTKLHSLPVDITKAAMVRLLTESEPAMKQPNPPRPDRAGATCAPGAKYRREYPAVDSAVGVRAAPNDADRPDVRLIARHKP